MRANGRAGGRDCLQKEGGQSPPPRKKGRRTVPPASLACTQRGGRHVGKVGHINWGWQAAQPRRRGLSTNGKEEGGALSMLRLHHACKGVAGVWVGWGV